MKNILTICCYILFFSIILNQNLIAATAPKLKEIPAWVKPITATKYSLVKENKVTDGYYYLTVNSQINAQTEEHFNAFSLKVVNTVGVQNASEVSFSFNPKYQQASVNYIRVLRDGKSINKFVQSELKVMQREEELETKIYDGNLTAFTSLKDIRIGDIVEYAYTIKGRNPVYKGNFFTALDMAYSIPVELIYNRIIIPENRKIYHKTISSSGKNYVPIISTKNGVTSYEWTANCHEPLAKEDRVPNHYIAYPFIDITEFNNWEQVVNWALPLYQNNITLNQNLKQKIKDLTKDLTSTEEKIVALFRFVQNQIRYMGFEIGVGSHKPNNPNTVFINRFGDCKDKAYLLCNMLKEIGVTAYPNLVHATEGKSLKNVLPSPNHFNHVTVLVEHNGSEFWLDPTFSHQGGTIHSIQYPNYGYTLLIKKGNNSLILIEPKNTIRKTTIKEIFTVADSINPIKLKVITEYEGIDADDVRVNFETSSKAEIEKSYIDYYNSLYKTTNLLNEITFTDDLESNIFTTTEEYELPELWEQDEETLFKKFELYHSAMLAKISLPETRIRKMPYALNYPLHYLQTIEVNLPENWPFTPERSVIDNDFFWYRFESYQGASANCVILDYELKTKADEVPLDKTKSYIKDVENVKKYNMYQFFWNDSVGSNNTVAYSNFKTNWLLVFIALLFVAFMYYLAVKYYKFDVVPENPDKGIAIGGWLVISLIACCLAPLINIYGFIQNSYFNMYTWQNISAINGSLYHPLWPSFYLFEMLSLIFIIGLQIFILYLFFNKRSTLPRFIIFGYIIVVFFNTIELFMLNILPVNNESVKTEIGKTLVKSLIGSAIWIPYYLKSERVKETFVKTYDPEFAIVPEFETENKKVEAKTEE